MRSPLFVAWRWLIHHGTMIIGFVALAFYEVWPSWRGGWWNRVGNFVLPAAGYYAYASDPWARSADQHWIKTGSRDFTPEAQHER